MGRPSARWDSRPRPGAASAATECWCGRPRDSHADNIMLKNNTLAVCDSPLIVMESDWHFHWCLVRVSHEGWCSAARPCCVVLSGAVLGWAGLGGAGGPVKLWAKDVAQRPYLLFSVCARNEAQGVVLWPRQRLVCPVFVFVFLSLTHLKNFFYEF